LAGLVSVSSHALRNASVHDLHSVSLEEAHGVHQNRLLLSSLRVLMDLIGKTMVAEVLLHVNNLRVNLQLLFLIVSGLLLLHLDFLLVLLNLVLTLQTHQLTQIIQISDLLILLLYY